MGARSTLLWSLLLISSQLLAQEKEQPRQQEMKVPEEQEVESLDAGESLLYMGKKLWFETRKRLNLATEDELKKEEAAARKVKLKLGGIRLEN